MLSLNFNWSTRPIHSHGRKWSLFSHVLSVRPSQRFKISQNNFQARIVIAYGATVSLAEWIIDDTHVLLDIYPDLNLRLLLLPSQSNWSHNIPEIDITQVYRI